ncbi:hypothetical protein FB561_3866 [Kribbella amoyensis]|uniref:Uncharacterized protein n=1 Tax=Kribbella amoyensis TaxID=996641 RepID=A0A561BV10_9ACTN|nr:hypothetical protein [Kribbella amoyensis]TWD82726.1 hypothetical protein FB561_3866 [Kribbella amoyensis]
MAAAFAYILTNGTSAPPADPGAAAGRDVTVTSTPPSADPAPTVPTVPTPKADRKPPAQRASPPAANTGAETPTFKAGQWIAVLDSYPTDAGMAADQVAKDLAADLIAAGVPAKAMLAGGQYPGLAGGDQQPMTNTWVVYLGPYASSEAANALCVSPKTQRVHANVACPAYEPATPLG